jgi:calcineurin-like phosphoesterase
LPAAMPQRFEVAINVILLYDVMIEIDDANGKAIKIQRMAEAINT